MFVLGIESTCDETACSIVEDGKKILSNVVSSQQDIHKKYGGVYPELASRLHIDAILPTIDLALKEAGLNSQDIALISVARGPGLIGALLIGLSVAKALSFAWDVPYIGVNHVEAHLYAAMMEQEVTFPALGVVVSGGHTFMIAMLGLGDYTLIGSTVDDAIGEAFDKVGTMLGLGYPGGPLIEKMARDGNPHAYKFNAAKVKGKPFDFSFSGLKTAVLYAIKGKTLSQQEIADVAASFQEAAFKPILDKVLLAIQQIGAKSVLWGGGVCCNERLRTLMYEQASCVEHYFPAKSLCMDNAAMIAGLGYYQFLKRQQGDDFLLEPLTRIPL